MAKKAKKTGPKKKAKKNPKQTGARKPRVDLNVKPDDEKKVRTVRSEMAEREAG